MTETNSRYLESYPKEKMQKDADEWGAYCRHIQKKWGVGSWAKRRDGNEQGNSPGAAGKVGERRGE